MSRMGIVIVALAALAGACSPEPGPEPQDRTPRVKVREAERPRSSAPERDAPARRALRFTVRPASGGAAPVTTEPDPASSVLFLAPAGEQGEIVSSQAVPGGGRRVTACDVILPGGRGWLAEAHVADVAWEGAEQVAAATPSTPAEQVLRWDVQVVDGGTLDEARNGWTPGTRTAGSAARDVARPLRVVAYLSEYCPACRKFAPRLQALAQEHPEITVQEVDINRPGVRDRIDFDGPIARQERISSVPYLRVYDADGKLKAEGKAARALLGI